MSNSTTEKLKRKIEELQHVPDIVAWVRRYLAGEGRLGLWPELPRSKELASFLKVTEGSELARELREALLSIVADLSRSWHAFSEACRAGRVDTSPYVELLRVLARAAIVEARMAVLNMAQWDSDPVDPLLHLEILRTLSALQSENAIGIFVTDTMNEENGGLFAPICISSLLSSSIKDAFMLLPFAFKYSQLGTLCIKYADLCVQAFDRLRSVGTVKALEEFWRNTQITERIQTIAAQEFFSTLIQDLDRGLALVNALKTEYEFATFSTRQSDQVTILYVEIKGRQFKLEIPFIIPAEAYALLAPECFGTDALMETNMDVARVLATSEQKVRNRERQDSEND